MPGAITQFETLQARLHEIDARSETTVARLMAVWIDVFQCLDGGSLTHLQATALVSMILARFS